MRVIDGAAVTVERAGQLFDRFGEVRDRQLEGGETLRELSVFHGAEFTANRAGVPMRALDLPDHEVHAWERNSPQVAAPRCRYQFGHLTESVPGVGTRSGFRDQHAA